MLSLSVVILVLSGFSTATLTSIDSFHLNPEKLISKMEDAMGGKDAFYAMRDVRFDYTFEYIGSGKKDVSEERMIFDGEHTYAKYTTHESLVMPDVSGDVIHAWVNGKAYVYHNGTLLKDEKLLRSCEGIRKANYYWFTMMYKLSDPGIILTALDHDRIDGVLYHKVKVEYDQEIVGKEENDAYILYINAKTNLVDRFHFGVPEDESNQGVKILVEYETVGGLKVPAKRSAFMPDADGNYSETPRLVQTSRNFKFKNGFSPEDLIPS